MNNESGIRNEELEKDIYLYLQSDYSGRTKIIGNYIEDNELLSRFLETLERRFYLQKNYKKLEKINPLLSLFKKRPSLKKLIIDYFNLTLNP